MVKTKMIVVSEKVHKMIFDECPKALSVSDYLEILLHRERDKE